MPDGVSTAKRDCTSVPTQGLVSTGDAGTFVDVATSADMLQQIHQFAKEGSAAPVIHTTGVNADVLINMAEPFQLQLLVDGFKFCFKSAP